MSKNITFKIGSQNKVKLEAVREILEEYPALAGEVVGVEVPSGVPDQPLSLEETVRGAMNRARDAYRDCDYGIGIESGIMQVPATKSGYMDICACAIYDGREFHLGLSSAWEFPDPKVMDLLSREGLTMEQAAVRAGLTENAKVGSAEGVISILTKGRLNRKEYTKQALRTALIHLDI